MNRENLNGETCPTCNRTIEEADGHILKEDRYLLTIVSCPMK